MENTRLRTYRNMIYSHNIRFKYKLIFFFFFFVNLFFFSSHIGNKRESILNMTHVDVITIYKSYTTNLTEPQAI